MHKKNQILAMAKIMAEKIISLKQQRDAGDVDSKALCYQLDDIESLARLVTADLGEDYND